MYRDMASNLSAAYTQTPVVRSATNNGASVDLLGFNGATVYLMPGIGGITFDGTNRIDFALQHSTDNSTWVNVTDADVVGVTGITSGIVRSLITAHAAASITEIGYVGGRRYIRLNATFGGTHGTGTPLAALVVRGEPEVAPVA